MQELALALTHWSLESENLLMRSPRLSYWPSGHLILAPGYDQKEGSLKLGLKPHEMPRLVDGWPNEAFQHIMKDPSRKKRYPKVFTDVINDFLPTLQGFHFGMLLYHQAEAPHFAAIFLPSQEESKCKGLYENILLEHQHVPKEWFILRGADEK